MFRKFKSPCKTCQSNFESVDKNKDDDFIPQNLKMVDQYNPYMLTNYALNGFLNTENLASVSFSEEDFEDDFDDNLEHYGYLEGFAPPAQQQPGGGYLTEGFRSLPSGSFIPYYLTDPRVEDVQSFNKNSQGEYCPKVVNYRYSGIGDGFYTLISPTIARTSDGRVYPSTSNKMYEQYLNNAENRYNREFPGCNFRKNLVDRETY